MAGILWTIAAMLTILWLITFAEHIAGNFIPILLVIAAIVVGNRSTCAWAPQPASTGGSPPLAA